jgi:hypothetical protein
MKKIYFILLLSVLSACGCSRVLVDDLVVKENKFYKVSVIPYSGYAYTWFEDGGISNEIHFKDGVPSGDFTVYGQDGEIVQTGTYKPVNLDLEAMGDLKNIKRLNICETYEGEFNFLDIFLVTNDLKEQVDKQKTKLF